MGDGEDNSLKRKRGRPAKKLPLIIPAGISVNSLGFQLDVEFDFWVSPEGLLLYLL